MADPILITFDDVSIESSSNLAKVSGSIEVDYGTNPPTVISGTLSVSVNGVPAASFSNLTVIPAPGNVFAITGSSDTNLIQFGYVGQEPSHLGGMGIGLPSLGLGFLATSPADFASNIVSSTVVCFAAGTLIRTPQGDLPIETLQQGDLVITSSGAVKPIKWVGHRVLDCRNHPVPGDALPVRIAAGAFGPSRPSQDLYLSPGHSICVDLCGEVFIHAANLVNGATITQADVETIDYWHIELDGHDVVIANNLTAESYLPMANRGFFAGADAAPDGAGRSWDDFCRPVVTGGPVLDFVRQRLLRRAEAMGWTRSREADLRLVVDGDVVRPLTDSETSIFRFPADARDVRLASHTFVASHFGYADRRELGVQLLGLSVATGRGEIYRTIDLADPRLEAGFHPEEAHAGAAWRWTKGELALPVALWEGPQSSGQITLRVSHDGRANRQWAAPRAAAESSALVDRRLSA